jgi:hypothetical protein
MWCPAVLQFLQDTGWQASDCGVEKRPQDNGTGVWVEMIVFSQLTC